MQSYYGSLHDRNVPRNPGRRNGHHKNVILFEPNGHVVMSTEEGRRGRSDPEGAVSVRCFSKDPPAGRSPALDDYRRDRIKDGFKYVAAGGSQDFGGKMRHGGSRDGTVAATQYSSVPPSPSLGGVFDGNGRDAPAIGFKCAPAAHSPFAERIALDDYFKDGPADAFDLAQSSRSPGLRDEVLDHMDGPGHGFGYSPTADSPVLRRVESDGSIVGVKYTPESPSLEREDGYRRDPPMIGFKCAPSAQSPALGREDFDDYRRDIPRARFDYAPAIPSPSVGGELLDRYCKDGPAVGFNYGVAPYHVHHRMRHGSSKEQHDGKRHGGKRHRGQRHRGMRRRHNDTQHGCLRHHVQGPSDYRRIQDAPCDGRYLEHVLVISSV